MSVDQRRVVIVNAGGRYDLSASKGSYDMMVDSMKRLISGFKRKGLLGETTTVVKVVESLEEAESFLVRAEVLIFVTLGLRTDAQTIKNKYPNLKVVVLTGLLPKSEVIIVDKRWLTPRLMEDLVFDPV